jgi:hypothetical protein
MTRHDSIAPTIDDTYSEIFGTPPEKPGVAIERLAAIVMYTLEEGDVIHDARKVGQFSETPYQLDAHHRASDGQTEKMVEATDFSRRNAKVGREHLQKLAGALPDLDPIDAGAFVSATGYTGPAGGRTFGANKVPRRTAGNESLPAMAFLERQFSQM